MLVRDRVACKNVKRLRGSPQADGRLRVLALKIISGGQSGVDRAALDVASALGIEHGGWCPKGRWAEDGPIGSNYSLIETPLPDPEQRTEWNVRDSDATVIFSRGEDLHGGTRRTLEFAQRDGKPWLHLHGHNVVDGASKLAAFIKQHELTVLNVAGPRASEEPEAASFAREVLFEVLRQGTESGSKAG